jgi:hypothetical protein
MVREDHGNEWCAREPEKDVIFCFDKHSGCAELSFYIISNPSITFSRYGGYGQPGWGYGVRNIIFSSPDPKVPPETWIRLEDGTIRARIKLDDNYGR